MILIGLLWKICKFPHGLTQSYLKQEKEEFLRPPITLIDLSSHNLQANASSETEDDINKERKRLRLIVKGINSKGYSAFSWLTPILLSFY